MTESIYSHNIDKIVDEISNLNINDETGEIKHIQDIVKGVEIRRSGRVITKPLKLTYEKPITAQRKNKDKKTKKKTKYDIVYTNGNGDITIVLDQTSGCKLYNGLSVGTSTDEKPWKNKMKQDIEEIMNITDKMERYNKLIYYRDNLSHKCNFWQAKKMLQEYSNILKNNEIWKDNQKEIIDLYKTKHNVELSDDELYDNKIKDELTGDKLKD